MPEKFFPIETGVFKDETPLKSEGYAVDTQGYRIHRNGWQTQRGYERAASATFTGLVRGSAAWSDLSGVKAAGFGTATALYLFYGGSITDVTPDKLRGTGTDIFTTVNGSPVITVGISNHGLKEDDTFNQTLADAVGGITLDASYTVTEILDINRFTITHGSSASSSATGGGTCEYNAPIDAGLVDGTGGIGYGTGTYGSGLYGIASVGDTEARRWAISPWGQNMLACAPGGPLYEQQPRISYLDLLEDIEPTLGTGWSGTATLTAVTGTASTVDYDLTGVWAGGDTLVLTMDVTVSSGEVQVEATSSVGPVTYDVGEAITETGTYTRYFQAPPSPTTFALNKNATFAGTINSITLKVAENAYRINSAPQYSNGVVVDAKKIAIVWSTVRVDGVYDRLCVRWSDLGDNKTWIPSTDNYAGENSDFGLGSQIIAVVPTNRENLVFTDAGVYSMQFTGELGNAYEFNLIGGGAGLKSPDAVVAHAGRVFWLGQDDNFYIYQGSMAQIIECPLRRDMVDNIAIGQDAKINASVQAAFSEIRFCYADSRDGNEVSRALVFNWAENKWYNDTELRTDRIGTSIFRELIGFGSDGYIYYHDLGNTANGNALTTSLKTGFYDADDGNNLTLLRRFLPDFDDQVGDILMTVITRDRSPGTETTFGPYTITPTTTEVPLRIMARQFALQFDTDIAGTENRFGSFRMDLDMTGARR
jgi:hypothetical protein